MNIKNKNIVLVSLFVLFILLIISCDHKKETLLINIIPVASSVGNYSILNLSEYASEIRYKTLETNESVLVGAIRQIIYENEKILTLDYSNNCFLFDNNGTFLRKIGQFGQGPDDYISIGQVWIHENYIYQIDARKILIYDINGYLVEKNYLLSNEIPREYSRVGMGGIIPLKKDTFIMNVVSAIGYYPKAILFDVYQSNIKLIKEYPSYVKLDKLPPGSMSSDELGIMYRYLDEVRTYKVINDTVFTIDQNTEMKDGFIFELGKYRTTLSFIEGKVGSDNSFDYSKNFITPKNIFESHNHLFIEFDFGNHAPEPFELRSPISNNPYTYNRVYGVFDKYTGKIILMKQPIKRKLGFKNDVDNGPVIWPHYISSNNELVTYILPEEFMDYYEKTENPTPQMTEIAKNLKFDDNPIVIITKIKEKGLGKK